MFGTSNARARQFITLTCLVLVFIFSIIIMGLVGVNGKVTFRSLNKGCLLYMSVDGDVVDYNNGYCLFPIIGAAVIAVITLVFMMYWAVSLKRRDEFAPRPISLSFIILMILCALLAFAICGEIGIGLNNGCKILGDDRHRCRKTNNFNALWGAEICAGMIGGLLVIAVLLELFQLKCEPSRLLPSSSSVEPYARTTVVPHHASTTATGNTPYKAETTAMPTPTLQGQKAESTEPEMTQHQFYNQGRPGAHAAQEEHRADTYGAYHE